ncbi:DUF6036 family nucleotidyltransferase [Geminisphaera colitermitum]|uniref:DUF6036 family nucleotidyltransferase n=1 Tax=Geminisphaera colitermitum TaxID=1148786 RepID=UPI0001965082|nr:DUF6036 family nucleotidyltransferase [Geminisphaera colitermitum]
MTPNPPSQAFPELTAALSRILDRLDASLRESGYDGEPVAMYLADGLAVNYYCGSRYTGDIDASFSHRFLLPADGLITDYALADGEKRFLYFDYNYTDVFALMHECHQEDSIEWAGIGNERRKIHLRVLAPLDLAVSKIARFSEQDRADIRDIARACQLRPEALRQRAEEALADFIGNKRPVLTNIDLAVRDITQPIRTAPTPQ